MKTQKIICLLTLLFVFMLSGCLVRTYQVTKDKVDQDLTGGNRGYLKGQAPYSETKEKKSTRTTQVVEIELRSPIKFERAPKQETGPKKTKETGEDKTLWGNQGYISREASQVSESVSPLANIESYTVQKGDTLQKISQKFYGTTKKWIKIYDANKDALKGPDKIYPGQSLNIPTEEILKETKENLK